MTHRAKTAWIERCAARLLVLRPSLLSEQALRLASERWEHQSQLDPEAAANAELRWEDASRHACVASHIIEGPAFSLAGLTLVPLAIGARHDYFPAARIEGGAATPPDSRRPVWTAHSYLHPSDALEAARWLVQTLVAPQVAAPPMVHRLAPVAASSGAGELGSAARLPAQRHC